MDTEEGVFVLIMICLVAGLIGMVAWSYHSAIEHSKWVDEKLEQDCDPVAQDWQGQITAFKCPKDVNNETDDKKGGR